ncbi:MAG: hypothetical protein HY433_01155 [Candidatus Liptonbacteria bacterium]|nr:hypothetical protein [Candidatus Liptonbacteria bacterium]
MPELPEKQNNSERVENPKLAEEMAYIEKPYRDESFERKEETQARYDFIHSDAYREYLRKIQEEHLERLNYRANHLDEIIKERLAREEAWKREREVLEKMDLEERGKEIERFGKEEMEFDEEKIQAIKERYKRFLERYLASSEQRLDELFEEMVRGLDEEEFNEDELREAREYAEGPIPTGIKKAEDYQRTYLRRAKQKPLSEQEALKEGSLVQEQAREQVESLLPYGEMMTPLGPREEWGWEELTQYNDVRNWVKQPLDEHITSADYDKALEYIERLKEVKPSDLVTWLTARLQLKSLEIKAWLRNKKKEAEGT